VDARELASRFTHHPPDEERAKWHALVCRHFLDLADNLNMELPDGREKALVMTHLEEAMFWSNAAIARQQ
jgi:hypothetical protein